MSLGFILYSEIISISGSNPPIPGSPEPPEWGSPPPRSCESTCCPGVEVLAVKVKEDGVLHQRDHRCWSPHDTSRPFGRLGGPG